MCREQMRRLDLATERHWRAAADRARWRLHSNLLLFQSQLAQSLTELSPGAAFQQIPTQQTIYEELLALRGEFDDIELDLRSNTLSVLTEEITLEGVYLGKFRIELPWNDLVSPYPYRVVAETPNPSESRSGVTHPHVNDDVLCEGDAGPALRHALRTGRLCDFFQIVWQTLQTYNGDSAYVSLDEWTGQSCHACGSHVHEDESSYCDHCEATICGECGTSCSHCGESGCDGCIAWCSHCHENCCSTCMKRCTTCNQLRCPDCRTNSPCKDCHVPDPDSDTNDDDDSHGDTNDDTELHPESDPLAIEIPPPTDTPVQPDRVGKVAVSA